MDDLVQAVEDLLNRMDDDGDEEREGDIQAFLEATYPSLDAQNS